MSVPLSLYVHLPWCVRKCPYCDFNSHALHAGVDRRRYLEALLRDVELEAPRLMGRAIESIFFGGGTPSLFAPDDFARLLAGFGRALRIAPECEITLEANPGTLERGRFREYRDAGINRVSLGVQSFAPQALARLGRIHCADDARRAAEELHAAGLPNFNIDLMYALPGQSVEEALADVREACALGPAHLSHYQLTLEPGTVFHSRPPPLPDEDDAFTMQLECEAELAAQGFVQYEVSAYARAGARCRHNLNYWRFGDYLGIGAGAHGKLSFALPVEIVRTSKPKQPRIYQLEAESAHAPLGERSGVPPASLPFEFMLNALRLNEGFRARDFEERTGLSLEMVRTKLERAHARGLLDVRASEGGSVAFAPTRLGSRFLNDLQVAFLE